MAGQLGKIPNYGKSQVNPMGSVEPPACIQNAMMTKDKKPFTYTPGGLDLSQIKTPSMARRLARQRSQEEHEQAYAQYHSTPPAPRPQGGPGPNPPPPPPPQMPSMPPPPPPLVIEAPNAKSPKPVVVGERPEIVIPENPIGMLRKTNSPYHWEAEQAEMQKLGSVPKFVEKVPSPLTVKMPPSTFSQQPPQSYNPQAQTNMQRQNHPYGNHNNQHPESPILRPEAQYASHQNSGSPNINGSPVTRDILQRQDSQFNKSPQPFANQSPVSNGSDPYSPTPNNNWRLPERRDSPANNMYINNTPPSPLNRNQFSPNIQQYSPTYQNQPPNSGPIFNTLPRSAPKTQDGIFINAQNSNAVYNNVREPAPPRPRGDNSTPWRTNTNRQQPREPENVKNLYHNSQTVNQQPTYTPPWQNNETNNSQPENNSPAWKQDNRNANQTNNQQNIPPWVQQDNNNNRVQDNCSPPWRTHNNAATYQPNRQQPSQPQETPRYQSSMSIPVTPKKQNPQPESPNASQREIVYVNQEPVYYCPDSPKTIPPWVKTQKEKTKTPPPAWCQRPLEGRKSLPRELVTPPRDNGEPEWVKKSNEMQRGVRDVVSPPKYQQTVQPSWSTRPSDNRKSLPKDNLPSPQGARTIPVQMEYNNDQGRFGNQQPPLKIVINMQQHNSGPSPQGSTQVPYSQPTQRIMRVLSPQLVRLDDGPSQPDLPTLNRSFQTSQESHPKERIIPIQIEGGGSSGQNKSVFYYKFSQEGPPRQSKAFRVLQIITGTQDTDDNIQDIGDHRGYTDL